MALGLGLLSPCTAQASVDLQTQALVNMFTRVMVPVQLNGERTCHLVLDTGAERSCLSDQLVQSMNLRSGPRVLIHGITTSQGAETVQVAQVRLGQRQFADLVLPVLPHGQLGADGLLGLDILRHFKVTLDLARRSVNLEPSHTSDPLSQQPKSFASLLGSDAAVEDRKTQGQIFLTRLRVGGVAATGFIDSGAQHSIANLNLMTAMDRQMTPEPRVSTTVYGVVGPAFEVLSGQAQHLQMAGRRLGPTPLLFADLNAFEVLDLANAPALLIGADILTRFSRVVLDYGRGRITLGRTIVPDLKQTGSLL